MCLWRHFSKSSITVNFVHLRAYSKLSVINWKESFDFWLLSTNPLGFWDVLNRTRFKQQIKSRQQASLIFLKWITIALERISCYKFNSRVIWQHTKNVWISTYFKFPEVKSHICVRPLWVGFIRNKRHCYLTLYINTNKTIPTVFILN